MATILLTDGQQRKTLSAVRSLGRAGHKVLVAEVTRFATARFSRYSARGLVCPDPQAAPQAFLDWLRQTVRTHAIDALLPMDDATTEIVARASPTLGVATLLPDPVAFHVARDKLTTIRLAEETGVRAPLTFIDLQQALESDLGWPRIVKARHGSGSRGIRRVGSEAELRAAHAQVHQADPDPMIQAYIPPGRKFDVCLLYGGPGELLTSFVQEELRSYPHWGGPSTLQESVDRPDLVALALRLLAPLNWQGPVEVEFMEDPRTGEPVLMEINPRFWASLDLAVRCGIDFPRWTAELALGERPAVTSDYPIGRRCRWLLPGDLLHVITNPDRRSMDPAFFSTMDNRTHDDILSWEDPGPTLGFFLATLRYLFDLRMWRMIIR